MEIELRRSKGPSLESILSFLPYLFVVLGGYVVYDGLRSDAPFAVLVPGIVLLAAAAFMWLAPGVLQVRLGPQAIEVRVLSGTRRFPYASLGEARIVGGRLVARLLGAGLAGYHTGTFILGREGRVRAYTSTMKGPFVLVSRGGRPPLLLSPADPEAFLEAYAKARGATRAVG